ncbi:hypothetical protein SCB71_09570 [Herbiconiux sp. KACC 21604]|uniref:hypothetical protein n=1 Tax=unclassified Herbiconiux TaxID=2618217 RepID=UPI001490DC51|nr:hypothetical protein [Herbiconiux sp. SALV-R1]QJU53492.1 hypothetical protein HL652_07525 [Herbiconiux sp. SALV-R1]WPO88468.1 hypothetical protein SCB71_09570 [Herbiconiux sp. KACC 21604]
MQRPAPEQRPASRRRALPSPSAGLIAAVVLAAIGYLLPWFKGARAEWWYSGWRYLTQSDGGWTTITLVLLAAALVAAVWAGEGDLPAVLALTTLVAALVVAVLVVAASIAAIGSIEGSDSVAELDFGIGVPVMAVGFGLGVATGCHAIASAVAADTEARIRARLG